MKPIQSILFTTDFSHTANNALVYAQELAKSVNAKLYILHACRIPNASTAAYPAGYYEAVNINELKLEADKKMGQLQHDFLFSPAIEYECITLMGPASEVIGEVAEEKQVDLIVMGTRQADGLLEWLGSVTSDVAEKSTYPLLAIPHNAQFSIPKKFLLTTTLSKHSSLNSLDQVKELVQLFGAELDVLYIHPHGKEFTPGQVRFQTALENFLEDIPHHLHIVAYDDVSEGIQKYVTQNEVDVLTMIPQQHSFFAQLFRASKTRHMLFHTHLPLLLVQD
ncbi:universal stress protein [Tunicatimonas pelagia]|uniref:universal stress protein n=1 Tax=Tunicatimonas pelagia TaxID=931531 RepID=UPI0026655D4E|nr:universal stress protein [Tunicatimonas pelagia]WKN43413.1 universal stress protein [Tunicatimonas pelagia]